MLPAGHPLIKSRLLERNAPLAGEMSGHILFADRYFGADDAVYAPLRLLGVLGQSSTGLAELVEQLPVTFATPEIRIPCSDLGKFAIVEIVRERLCRRGAHVIAMMRCPFGMRDGWWLIRVSRTQPAIVLRVEAKNCRGASAIEAAACGCTRCGRRAAPCCVITSSGKS
jgi:phosphomannomutase